MTRLRTGTGFAAITLVVACCVVVGPWVALLAETPGPELREQMVIAAIGVPLLLSPYVGLAMLGRGARGAARYAALGLLVAPSALLIDSTRSDALGALLVFYTLPFQWAVAVAVGSERFRQHQS